MSRFWGSWWAKTIGAVTPVAGAALGGAPRVVGWANGESAHLYYGGGIALAILGVAFQLVDGWRVERNRANFRERLNFKMASMHRTLPTVMTSGETSQDHVRRVVEAVQTGTRELIDPEGGDVRVCVYRVDLSEEPPSSGSTKASVWEHRVGGEPLRDSMLPNLGFVRVTDPSGRDVEETRETFTYDAEGKHTLELILKNEAVWCPDTKRNPTPGLKTSCSYRRFLVVPIMIQGSVEGMLACDSRTKGGLARADESTMRMTAMVAGLALQAGRASRAPSQQPIPVKPPGAAGLATTPPRDDVDGSVGHTGGGHHG